jgi:hypothetical protein
MLSSGVMKAISVALITLACSKSSSESSPAIGSAAGSAAAPTSDEPAAADSPEGTAAEPAKAPSSDAAKGITVKHHVSEMSGNYDLAYAQVDQSNNQITIAFVRGCPKLTCSPGPWEAEQVVGVCPDAYLATAKVPRLTGGRHTLDVSFAGPMNNVSTATLEGVRIELKSVDINARITGTVSQKTSESSAKGSFTAKVCPRT